MKNSVKTGVIAGIISFSCCYLIAILLLFLNLIDFSSDKESTKYYEKEEDFSQVTTKILPQLSSFLHINLHIGKKEISLKVNSTQYLNEDYKYGKKVIENEIYSGLYLVVLHQETGKPLIIDKYATYAPGGEFDLLSALLDIQNGRIILLASVYESFQSFSDIAKNYLMAQGSKAINDIRPGDRWLMVWTKGGRVWAEDKVICMTNPCILWQGGKIDRNLIIPSSDVGDCPLWSQGKSWKIRQEFCQNHDGYGPLCSCEMPLSTSGNKVQEFGNLENAAVLIVASQRPLLLNRCLKKLLETKGFNPLKTFVAVDGLGKEVTDLLQIHNLMYATHDSKIKETPVRITDHYFFALKSIFTTFQWAEMIIVIEEDLLVSPDFFSYFSQLVPVLKSDPSFYCISAWNDFSFFHSASNASVVQLTDTMPGLGWLLTRKLFNEFEVKWPKVNKVVDWDMWMRLDTQRRGRYCIIPEVPRTFHYGRKGAHTSAVVQSVFYDNKSFNREENVILHNLDRLNASTYESDLKRKISSSIHLDGNAVDPCGEIVARNQSQSYVLWFKMNFQEDKYTWKALSYCLGLWNLDIRGGFKKVWQIRYSGTELLMIGWPASPFSNLKPNGTNVVRRSSGDKAETEPPFVVTVFRKKKQITNKLIYKTTEKAVSRPFQKKNIY